MRIERAERDLARWSDPERRAPSAGDGVDPAVRRARARWPDIPAVYGWLVLDRRGEWRLRNPANGEFERIGNVALREFIARNYAAEARGAWFFQNGPQRVYARLECTPLVFRRFEDGFRDHCGRASGALDGAWLDEHGALFLAGARGVGVIDDRDLGAVSSMLEDRRGGPVDPAFDWTAAAPGDVRLRLSASQHLELGRVVRAGLGARFGFQPDPTG